MIKHTFSNPPFLPFFSLLLFIGNQYNFIFMALQRLFWPLRFFLLLIICICMFTSQIGHNLISYLIKLQRNWNCLQRTWYLAMVFFMLATASDHWNVLSLKMSFDYACWDLFSLNEWNPSLQTNWKYGVMKSENRRHHIALKYF